MMQYDYAERVQNMRPSIIRELLKQMADPGLISFAGGNPAVEAFPAQEIGEISAELFRKEKPAATLQYSISEGLPHLRLAARAYMNREVPTLREEDDLIVVSGSQQSMDFMAKLLCNDGDAVATENPAFLGALNTFRSFGAELRGVPMEPDGVNLEALERVLSTGKKPKFYYTIPNFQNPTGYTTSAEKRRGVYQLCVRYGVPIYEDNPYGELRFAGEDIPPIKSLDEEGAVVYAASFSKILAPGLRLAFCAGPRELIAKMVVAKQGNDVHTNLWAQRVADKFLTSYSMDEHIARLREIYREKARRMMTLLDEKLGGRVRYVRPEGGMFIWVTLPDGTDMHQFVQDCLADRLALVPGNAFMVDGTAPCQNVRLNFTTPTPLQMEQGVEIMKRHLK